MKLTQLAAAVLLTSGSLSGYAATYTVTPLPLDDMAKYNFGQSIDNSGQMLTVTQFEYNPPVDLEQLEEAGFFEGDNYPLESEEDVKAGVFSNADYSTIVNFLLNARGNRKAQQLARYRSYITDTVDATLIPGFDQVTETFNDYTQSVETIARDSVGGDFIVGSSEGVYKDIEYTNNKDETTTFTYNETNRQAFVQVNGVTKLLPPAATLLNGIAEAHAINANLQVAGYGTTEFDAQVQENIDACSDASKRGDQPIELCVRNVRVTSTTFGNLAKVRATVWQLDSSGDMISRNVFPLVFEQADDDENKYRFSSRAFDINQNGIAVGQSHTGEEVRIRMPGSNQQYNQDQFVATTFADGKTTEILPREENLNSSAIAINDNNWVAGYVMRAPNEIARNRLFVYNLDSQEAKYPDGFFVSSGVVVNGINNNNIVVGKADVEASNESNREAHAFMYDIDSDEFSDLNDFIACDSEYTLLEAMDINDNNEIIVNARVRVPATYITGEEIINSEGETQLVDNIIAVKLTPNPNGQIEDCGAPEEEEDYERQGAAISFVWLFALIGISLFRRR